MSTCANSLGLFLDLVGAGLLWKFGLPPRLDPEGHGRIILEQADTSEIEKASCYARRSRFALVLLFLGFVFQLISNYLP